MIMMRAGACCKAFGLPLHRPRRAFPAMAAAGQSAAAPVVLLDIMDTVVIDPFFTEMPGFFGVSFQELLDSKHPTAWVEFERGEITEAELFAKFFKDGRAFDGAALVQRMQQAYRLIEGMEELLARLSAAGVEVHACSNYPSWYKLIEDRLALSRYLSWTFVSCEGPMRGLRKPSPECFAAVVDHLGVPAAQVLLVDDRQVNVDGAAAAGLQAVQFRGSAQLEEELRRRGVQF